MSLEVLTSWENLEFGVPEERACACHLKINLFDHSLTYVEDLETHETRNGVHVSAYPLAEWLAWNWWRLRWEPRRATLAWRLAHCLTSVGEGYIWPNISVVSDGERVLISAEPTIGSAAEPIRYLPTQSGVVRAADFEQSIDAFVERTCERLRECRIPQTDLDVVWSELSAERADPGVAERRRLEALLGFDPDEADAELLEQLAADATRYGAAAIDEIAATASGTGRILTPTELQDLAKREGTDGNPRDTIRVPALAGLPSYGSVPAWRLGVQAAKAVREEIGVRAEPMKNDRLEEMLAVKKGIVSLRPGRKSFAFGIDEDFDHRHIVLRSRYEENRRFEIARLLGDRLVCNVQDRIFIAPMTHTYRQKLQRAFAAELLCPVEAAESMLEREDIEEGAVGEEFMVEDQDIDEQISDIAAHYKVSVKVVRTLLVNNRVLSRDSMEYDREPTAHWDTETAAA